jgi:hypothetical protein
MAKLLFLLLLNVAISIKAKELIDYFEPERIKQNLREYTSEPHVAGTPANKRVAEKIMANWKEIGLEGRKCLKLESGIRRQIIYQK